MTPQEVGRIDTLHVCGDCGDVVYEDDPETHSYAHVNDGTPQCRNRDDARKRKPGYFADDRRSRQS